jgi:hypothetical protein
MSFFSSTNSNNATTTNNNVVLVVTSAVCGVAVYETIRTLWQTYYRSSHRRLNPETNFQFAHEKVWFCISGALQAAQLYVGDRLQLYTTLRRMSAEIPHGTFTAIDLAQETGYNQRWLREWLAQQASMGILTLLPGQKDDDASLHYRFPWATAQVLANPDHDEYDISMIAVIPALVHRAKTMLPEAFATGLGRPYDDTDVAQGIDRQHRKFIRNLVIPIIIPSAAQGKVLQLLQQGCQVADLGCGAGNLVRAVAQAFPKSTVHGYEVSVQALDVGATLLVQSKLKNAYLHDANEDPLGAHENEYDVLFTYDVLHDAPNPQELIIQARQALKPGGVWLLADLPARDTLRDNIVNNPNASTELSFSTCLCMSCSLSTPDGAGLGTMGFTVPVAQQMLREGGFTSIRVLREDDNTRWFEVM